MRRSRITITVNQATLDKVDMLVDHRRIRNRSHAIEYVLERALTAQISEAVILAGGKGTTLRPLTYEIPKAMLPIHGKPILFHTIRQLKASGIHRVIVCIGYLGEKIKEYFGDGSRFGVEIVYSEEKKPLQTGGALLQAKQYIQGDYFVVMNGDIVTDFSIADLIGFFDKEKPLMSMALTVVEKSASYGQLRIHGSRLLQFIHHEDMQTPLVNAGIYVCSKEMFNYFPKQKTSFMFEDVMDSLINQGKINGFLFQGQWFDVGSPEHYESAITKYRY